MSIVDQKYTAYDHFQGIGSYGEKKKTNGPSMNKLERSDLS